MAEPVEAESIHVLVNRVLGELPAIGKTAWNEQQKFHFRGIDAVLNALNPLLAKYGVTPVPHKVLERVPGQRQTRSGNVMYEVNLLVQFHLYGPRGDFIEAEAWGEGTDSGDKATSKAHTAAQKAMLIQVFNISTQEQTEEEPDRHSPEETTGRGAAQAPPPGWASHDEFTEMTRAVFDAVKNAPDEVKSRCREWRAVRGIEGSRFSKDDFGEFSELVESLLTSEFGEDVDGDLNRPPTPPAPAEETGELPDQTTMKADLGLWVDAMTEGQKAAFAAWCRMVEMPEDATTWTDDNVTDAWLHVKAQTSQ